MTPPRMDARGQALVIGRGLGILFFAGIIYTVYDAAMTPLMEFGSNNVTNTTASQGLTWTGQIWTHLPVVFVFVSALGVITFSVYASRGGF